MIKLKNSMVKLFFIKAPAWHSAGVFFWALTMHVDFGKLRFVRWTTAGVLHKKQNLQNQRVKEMHGVERAFFLLTFEICVVKCKYALN